MKKKNGHLIKEIIPESIADQMEVEPGDILLEINGEEIEDVFDFRFLIKDEELTVLIEKPDGEQWELEIEKDYDEELGIIFENDLMSEYRSCCNHCIFCFIDQMPPDMRETLYFKDDDSRLSFLQGNYITLTNMKQKDIDRIIRFHLAPINISVHTTNPELRCRMLHNRFAGKSLDYLKMLYDHQIEMNGQIVLCKGVNDGAELERTIDDLSQYLPFMRSVSVVPAGVTRFREGLYPIKPFTSKEAGEVIDRIEARQQKYFEQYGLHFIHASDEFYACAGRGYPEEERYDGYIQLENGVGMMRLLKEEFTESLQNKKASPEYSREKEMVNRTLTIATGKLAFDLLCDLSELAMEAYPGLHIHVCCIRNDFFGDSITVSGLITGQDLVCQIQEAAEEGKTVGNTLLLPSNMLKMGEEVFLDDVTVSEVENALGLRVVPVDTPGQDLLCAMLDESYFMSRENENYVYIQAYDR